MAVLFMTLVQTHLRIMSLIPEEQERVEADANAWSWNTLYFHWARQQFLAFLCWFSRG